jgi:N-acetylglucosamine-6-phosphate deacetylase
MLDDMSVEIIADGIHLPKPLLQFVYKFKGPKKTALCTDAMRGAGMPEGVYNLGSLEKGQPVIVEEGVAKLMDRSAFAGSVATADRLVRTMITLAEVPLADAVMMMTSTPARILGIQDSKGSLAEGLDADIVIFDENINIHKTIISGNVIYSSK